MNWMGALLSTYDNCVQDPSTLHERVPLVPICHTTVQVQIEVTLGMDGRFITADVVPKEQQTTIIPCTEASGGRTSGAEPHPLCDKLVYVAGDLASYTPDGLGRFVNANAQYLGLIRSWCDSEHGRDEVRAVLAYVERGTLVRDLLSAGVLVPDGNGGLADREQSPEAPLFAIAKVSDSQASAFVRWIVADGGMEPRLWESEGVRTSWIEYCAGSVGNVGLCYLTGETVPLAQNHPSKIRNAGDKAKIISSNDKSGYLFRGRFEDSDQAYGVGYEATQKAHSALRWLIGRQGYHEGDLCIVTWTAQGDAVHSPVEDFSEFLQIDSQSADTGKYDADALNRRIAGYNASIRDKDVWIMAMDSATPGRLSITMFREQLGDEFIAVLEDWHARCAWTHRYASIRDDDGKRRPIVYVGAPAPRDIAKAAYGEGADQKIISHAVLRILPCILDGTHIPQDLVDSTVRRAASPQSMKNDWEWRKTLSIACSVYKESKGGIYEMTLEKDRKSRDYLYGRLLAMADLLEGAALKDAGESRQTTAIRLMQRFSEFPYSTWVTIELALVPYMARLGTKAGYYRSRISEIMDMFDGEDFRDNRRLSGEFLLGYHCQIEEHYRKKEEKEE